MTCISDYDDKMNDLRQDEINDIVKEKELQQSNNWFENLNVYVNYFYLIRNQIKELTNTFKITKEVKR